MGPRSFATRALCPFDFIVDSTAVAVVQRMMYGALPEYDNSDDCPSALAHDKARLADLAPEARVAFELLVRDLARCLHGTDGYGARRGRPAPAQRPPSTGRYPEGDE